LRPNSKNASQQSTAKTDPEGPTSRASLIVNKRPRVTPPPQNESIA
jgi:hypothetical protein